MVSILYSPDIVLASAHVSTPHSVSSFVLNIAFSMGLNIHFEAGAKHLLCLEICDRAIKSHQEQGALTKRNNWAATSKTTDFEIFSGHKLKGRNRLATKGQGWVTGSFKRC